MAAGTWLRVPVAAARHCGSGRPASTSLARRRFHDRRLQPRPRLDLPGHRHFRPRRPQHLLGHHRRQPQIRTRETSMTMADRVIYLDHQATTPVDRRVVDAMLPCLTTAYGNPSSPHAYGRAAADMVRAARRQFRQLIGASADTEIIFTSGATEADHLAITGIAWALRGAGNHIVTTAIEH